MTITQHKFSLLMLFSFHSFHLIFVYANNLQNCGMGGHFSIAVYELFVLPLVLIFSNLIYHRSFYQKNSFCTSSFRCKNPFFGSTHFHWLSAGHDLCLSKVSVAADYPDSVPDSSSYMSNQAYHPLEEVKVSRRIRDTKLTSAEIARTTVEVCAYKHYRP
jgi:hypothetical protein